MVKVPKETILVLDDEKGIVALCKRLLENVGFNVITETDPIVGLQLLSDKEVDLLLVDIRMPKVDGFQVIETGRKHQPDMGVVIMTGYGTLETAIRALREGADGLILKPFEDGKELVDTVRQALEERRHKQEMARLQALRPLLDLSEGLFTETRPEALLDLILNAICGQLRCEHAGIFRRSGGNMWLSLVASTGTAFPEEESHPEGGLVGRSSYWKRPMSVNRDGPGDKYLQAILEEYGFSGVICTPVARGDKVMVFYAARAIGEPAFQAADLDLFGILSRQADIALENARLYGELRAYVRQVEDSQRALAQAEKMAAVGRLTASIAHEINNPLQSVLNCLHLAERKELSVKEREDYLALSKEELNRLMQTVRRMLDFYRPGALERTPTDIAEIIQKVLKLLEKQLEQNNIQVKNIFSKNVPVINLVSNQIQQVFFNIVLNAMDSMPSGGKLTIEGGQKSNSVEIMFKDTGRGVREDQIQQIFEPFMSTREDGSGLGLSVSYGIITAHGGNLELVDDQKKGACFRITLPIKETK